MDVQREGHGMYLDYDVSTLGLKSRRKVLQKGKANKETTKFWQKCLLTSRSDNIWETCRQRTLKIVGLHGSLLVNAAS